ncbi:unnamed protein product [Rotaria sordida]|uniref:Uncharacterized protein n=1 Tax=Rotaria sordida TaxID=392033 RepID=A0A814WJL0_9BILA|nr:unnamed protein product [Rotaria sordida]CAF1478492.1 unnamed protein product [Rotaria sordida]
MNEILLVQAHNAKHPPAFFIQFAPYNTTQNSSQCFLNYPDILDAYIYCVAVGKKPNLNHKQFFFAGELINNRNGIFVGVAKYNQTNAISNSSNSCALSFSYSLHYLINYEHQEHYIFGIEPQDRFAYGFSNQFLFVFDSVNDSTLESWNGNLTWPNSSFMPYAVDISDNFGVIAGFIQNDPQERVKYSPIIYLLNFNSSNHHPIVVDQYIPIATLDTWQDLLTYSDANVYSAKYDMSISINNRGDVLVGMQFINRVFLFSVNISNPIQLIYINRNTNGRSLGNGKSLAWLDNGNIAAILVNTYSLNYQWLSSQIYFYDMKSNIYNSNSVPISIFPNYHQLLPSSFSPVFLNIVSSPMSLTLMDDKGNLLIFTPTPPGFYPSILETRSMPFITSPQPCPPGMHKDHVGINDCILCPTGTKNSGNATTHCTPCASDTFCPLGSVSETPSSALENIVQLIAYPKSPESTIFDDVLLQNMFHIGTGHCLLISPLFWTLIVGGLAILIVILMKVLKYCIDHTTYVRIKNRTHYIFKKTDLIGEGELWVGGLASFSVVVLVCFAYAFSNAYYKQYPIETSTDAYFACDLSTRNAKFQSSLQTLGIPPSKTEKKMFDLLNEQKFSLNIEFINTLINCDVISIQALYGTIWSTIRWSNCQNNNSILYLSIPLPFQHISVQITLDQIQTIGALRIGLSGDKHEEELYKLKELNFYGSFSKNGSVLAQTLPISLVLTKVINETIPIEGEESDFTGIYISTFAIDSKSLFLTQEQYIHSTSQSILLTIVLSETAYYVKNQQYPIAKRAEIIFHNLLFTTVCLEIFGLVFLLYKLTLQPIYRLFHRTGIRDDEKHKINGKSMNGDSNTLEQSV